MRSAAPFSDLFAPALLKEIEEKSSYLELREGEALFETGLPVRYIPLILSGTVKVSRLEDDGRELLLYYIQPLESCAMSFTCCMQQQVSEVNGIAEEDVTLLAVPVEAMDPWLSKYPDWKSFVMRTVHQRFREMLLTIDQLAFQKLDERLVRYLKEKSKATGSAVIRLSHEQIATELATSRVVISRLLKKLELDKKVLLYRNELKILSGLYDPE